MSNKIIVIDDEKHFLDIVKRGLLISGLSDLTLEDDPERALRSFNEGMEYDIALIDITMPKINGIELLEEIKRISPSTECIMVSGLNEARTAVKSLKMGAYDYLVKPITREDLHSAITRALERKRLLDILALRKAPEPPRLSNPEAFSEIITESKEMLKLLREAELHAQSDVPILITGESGTGKELLARAIHKASPRKNAPFTALNMASFSQTLFDAEFFGYTKGAFTGAEKERKGYLEYTDGGTLFLDEIGILPYELQGKLLRVLQDGEFIKLGTNRNKRVNIRFIAATNENLSEKTFQGKFRKDLYYRLNGAWLNLPPLRERKEDIPPLISKFLNEFSNNSKKIKISQKAVSVLLDYNYPGNVRELKSIIQFSVNLAQGGRIETAHLPGHLRKIKPGTRSIQKDINTEQVPLEEVIKKHILKVYEHTGHNKTKTARILKIGLNTLRRKLASYGVS